jgi:hypothetical protein
MTKRYAANYVITVDGETLRQHVVELTDGCVTRLFPLNGAEERNVEWMLGAIELRREGGATVASHLYPYDFAAMSCVGETRRTRLL